MNQAASIQGNSFVVSFELTVREQEIMDVFVNGRTLLFSLNNNKERLDQSGRFYEHELESLVERDFLEYEEWEFYNGYAIRPLGSLYLETK